MMQAALGRFTTGTDTATLFPASGCHLSPAPQDRVAHSLGLQIFSGFGVDGTITVVIHYSL